MSVSLLFSICDMQGRVLKRFICTSSVHQLQEFCLQLLIILLKEKMMHLS